MKKIAGTLKIDQAQYRELEAFAKFGSDLDAATQAVLDKGERNVEILKQAEGSPMPVEKQIAIIYCGTNGLLQRLPVDKVGEFEKLYLNYLENEHADVLQNLKDGNINDDITGKLENACDTIIKRILDK